eukprot:Nk52_evm1s2384 gene=Nk52_evmTU1s2384
MGNVYVSATLLIIAILYNIIDKEQLSTFYVVLGACVVLCVSLLGYYGLFHPVSVRKSVKGPFFVVYRRHRGSYSRTGEICMNVRNRLQRNVVAMHLDDPKLVNLKTFGIFYDNPQRVKESQTRSVCGIIASEDSSKFAEIKKGMDALRNASPEYLYAIIPEMECIASEFPFKGWLSVLFGVMRVYPRLFDRAAKELNGLSDADKKNSKKHKEALAIPPMEVYDLQKSVIHYMIPVEGHCGSDEDLVEGPAPVHEDGLASSPGTASKTQLKKRKGGSSTTPKQEPDTSSGNTTEEEEKELLLQNQRDRVSKISTVFLPFQ